MDWESGKLNGDLILSRHTVGPLFMNAYLLASPSTGTCALIDPGDDAPLLLEAIEATGCRLEHLLCTHAHFDHISAAAEIQAEWSVPLQVHRSDLPLVESLAMIRGTYGFPPVASPEIAVYDGDGHAVTFAGSELVLRHAPGHCPGHVLIGLGGAMLVGDVIFEESIGRTDLPGGSYPVLEDTIRRLVYTLPPETVLHPGHGPSTTVAHEMRHNPFVTA